MGLVARERQSSIIELLQAENRATVEALAEHFGVSEATVRRDLVTLEKQGRIMKTYGGAVLSASTLFEMSYQDRLSEQVEAKRRIGAFAAGLAAAGSSVFLDSGTTCSQVAQCLRERENLTVVTNSLMIAQILGPCPGIKLHMTGGMYRPSSMDLLGPVHVQSLRSFAVDVTFLGVDGFDSEYGLSASDLGEAEAARAAIGIAKRVIVVADSTKAEKRAFASIGSFASIPVEMIVTDSNLSTHHLDSFHRAGVRVELV